MKCDEVAKEAVRGSTTRELREKRQQLLLEKVCVFIAGRKQTFDPDKDLKQQIGTVQVNAYYTSRKKERTEWTQKLLIC